MVTPVVCCKDLPKDDTEKEDCAGKDGVKDEAAIAPKSNLDKVHILNLIYIICK